MQNSDPNLFLNNNCSCSAIPKTVYTTVFAPFNVLRMSCLTKLFAAFRSWIVDLKGCLLENTEMKKLTYCTLERPDIWMRNRDRLCDDLLRKYENTLVPEEIYDLALNQAKYC